MSCKGCEISEINGKEIINLGNYYLVLPCSFSEEIVGWLPRSIVWHRDCVLRKLRDQSTTNENCFLKDCKKNCWRNV